MMWFLFFQNDKNYNYSGKIVVIILGVAVNSL